MKDEREVGMSVHSSTDQWPRPGKGGTIAQGRADLPHLGGEAQSLLLFHLRRILQPWTLVLSIVWPRQGDGREVAFLLAWNDAFSWLSQRSRLRADKVDVLEW